MFYTTEIRRLLMGIIILLLGVASAALYWAVVGPDTILRRQDNPRLVEQESELLRGTISDRNGILLAQSLRNPDGTLYRRYRFAEMNSALGYSSLRYGVSGAEAAYNDFLRGEHNQPSLSDETLQNLLHRPQIGADIRLTYDLSIQRAVVQAMGNRQGAVVVLNVADGAILAMVSQPTYDPNTLDENWDSLVEAPGDPFFNRVLQGTYQPGGLLQTSLMAAALLTNQPLDIPIEEAVRSVTLENIELQCLATPPNTAFTLVEAYYYGCPYPFAQLGETLGSATVESVFAAFQLDAPPTLAGYTVQEPTPVAPVLVNPTSLLDSVMGQGTVTVTPLEVAVIAAGIANSGNAPTPYSLLSYRAADGATWIPNTLNHTPTAIVTTEVARELQVLMAQSVEIGTAQGDYQSDVPISGHAALAYSGEDTQSWFMGFAGETGQPTVAIAVVLENNTNFQQAARIAGLILQTAHDRLSS
jgi:peptidoglycan glycosyltransferase